MKWGDLYDARYVNNLYRGVQRHLSLPHRFVCLTDDKRGIDKNVECYPLPDMNLSPERMAHGGFQKIGIFKKGLHKLEGICLFLDLDVVIVGSLDGFFDIEDDALVAVHEWPKIRDRMFFWRERGANSSVFAFRLGEQCQIYDRFMEDKDANFKKFRIEQYVVTHYARHLCYWNKTWVRSFKRDCMRLFPLNFMISPCLPKGASVIAFHGKPNPADITSGGRWGRGLRTGRGVVDWVAHHWR